MPIQLHEPPIQSILDSVKGESKITLHVKREDKIHPLISGNKWRKLKYNLEEAKKLNHHTLLTFGGAYSNHIHALAAAARGFGFKSIGVIRGEEHLPLNPTLNDAKAFGMSFHYMDRATYREKHSESVLAKLKEQFGEFYLIPEGGTNELAIKGASEIITPIVNDYDYYCCPCGTGGTAAGVISGLKGLGKVLGFSVLKGDFHKKEISYWLTKTNKQNLNNWEVITDYHFGGYAKYDLELIDFINKFKKETQIPLDPVYTGKMMFGIYGLIEKGYFPTGSRVLAIHTGGLQGINGFNERFGILLT